MPDFDRQKFREYQRMLFTFGDMEFSRVDEPVDVGLEPAGHVSRKRVTLWLLHQNPMPLVSAERCG